jgi:hypothetical protein
VRSTGGEVQVDVTQLTLLDPGPGLIAVKREFSIQVFVLPSTTQNPPGSK